MSTVENRETPEANTIQYKVNTWDNNATASYLRESMGQRLGRVHRDQVPMTDWSLDMLGDLLGLVELSDGPDPNGTAAVLLRHGDRHVTLVHVLDGWAVIRSASDDIASSQAACEDVARRIRTRDDARETQVAFWALDPEEFPKVFRRSVESPPWSDVRDNYSHECRAAVERLLELDACPDERMILWHGPSGTGKTHALQALIREWRPWCDAAFITDPEGFVGGSPTYLFEVANHRSGRSAKEWRRRSKLLICEDAGELMTPEARVTTGQGLSRLLNMTDGLIGQGLKVMVLITTNEPLSSLHPAVVRPGRCLQDTEFGALDTNHANQWLHNHGSSASVDKPTTLAELYATLAGRIPQRSQLAAVK